MSKDYAKRYKNPPKKQKRAKKTASLRRFFIIFIFLILFFSAIGGYIYYHFHSFASASVKVIDSQVAAVKPAAAPVVNAEEDSVNYEFYTLLPKITVPDPKQNNASPDDQPGYWLQLMIYYSMRDASAFVDRLQLSGLDPVITQRKSNKTSHDLFVVVLGPFSTKENALTRQKELKKMNIESYIFHVDPPLSTDETSASHSSLASSSLAPVVEAQADNEY